MVYMTEIISGEGRRKFMKKEQWDMVTEDLREMRQGVSQELFAQYLLTHSLKSYE